MNLNPSSRFARCCAALALLSLLTFSARAGTHNWSGDGSNNLWSNPDNWSAGGQPFPGEVNCFLIFPTASGYVSINDVTNLLIARMTIQHDNYIFAASGGAKFAFRGGASLGNNGYFTTFNNSANVELVGTNEWTISGDGYVSLNGVVSGAGHLVKLGDGTLAMGGSAPNTCTGFTTVYRGELRLAKTAGVTAIAGPLVIGSNVVADLGGSKVVSQAANQIADAAPIFIRYPGELNLNGFNESIGPLEMVGGEVDSAGGLLTLLSDVTGDGPHIPGNNVSCRLFGFVSLGNQSRTFSNSVYGSFTIFANISGGAGAGFTKKGAGGMGLYGTNSYSGPTIVAEGSLGGGGVGRAPKTPFGTTAAGTIVFSGAKLSIAAIDIGAEPLVLNGDAPGTNVAVFTSIGSCSWAGPVTLNTSATNTFRVEDTIYETGGDMTFSGVISGSGSLRYVGELVNGNYARLILSGASANTYSGRTLAEVGKMQLNKTAGVNAIAGPLVIGHDTPGAGVRDATVELLANNQISDTAPVSILPTGWLELGNFNDSITSLDMDGGTVDGDAGLLTLLGNVTSHGSINDGHNAFIGGRLSLGTQTRIFHCLQGSSLWISAVISGNGASGLTKDGIGQMALAGTNTYTGITTVAEGGLSLYSDLALGSPASGTVLAFNTALHLDSVKILNEPLESNGGDFSAVMGSDGTCSWTGPIVLNVAGEHSFYPRQSDLTLSGVISGQGNLRIITDEGRVILGGSSPNTYFGGTLVYAGELLLAKSPGVTAIPGTLSIGLNQLPAFPTSVVLSNDTQIADSADVTMWPNSVLNLNNHSEIIGSLGGRGDVLTQFASLITGGNNFTTTFHGTLSGAGFVPLVKQGTGTMLFTGTNYATGRTMVNNGKLIVHGVFAGPVWVNSAATLGGNGQVGNVASTNGIVSPGAGPGLLTAKSVTLDSASMLRIELNGTNAGVNYDQLRATGTVVLASCTLNATLGFGSAVGEKFTLIENDGNDAVVGTFAGLPQGAQLTLNAQKFAISYTGGTGNDVVLTHVNTPPSLTTITASPFANEGGSVSVDGVISDPDGGDSFALVVNWGDGSAPQTFNLPAGVFGFHFGHTYADDKPGAAASDSFTIEYTLTDSSGSPAFGNLNTVIGNVAPSFTAFAPLALKSGEALATTLTFADPGSDTWTATVNYGDGTGTQPLVVGAGKSLALNHAFPTNGLYTVTVTASDDDTGTGSRTLTVYVGLELTITKRNLTHSFIRWPGAFTGFTLESTPALGTGAIWTTVPEVPSLIGDTWQVTVPHLDGNAFFRLVKP